VRKILGPEKSLLPVGYILCALGAPAEAVPEEYETRNQETLTRHRGATVQTAGDAGGGPALAAGGGAVRATPAARRLAKEKGVDLAAVCKALCLNGPVNEKDINTYLERGNKAQQQQ
jgi:pyruvate dehydrogenase E2 component (dihydrolipoamide acetyltransferase)